MITPNENKIDRGLRIISGLILMGGSIALITPWGGTVMNIWGLVLGVMGLVPLLTGIIGWCPLYGLFKFSTLEISSCCKTKDETETPKAA